MIDMERVFYEGLLYAMEGKDPSKAIEDSERRGTIEMARSCRLPRKTNEIHIPMEIRYKGVTDDMSLEERRKIIDQNNYKYTRAQYERMGIKILEEYDDLFFTVELPEGLQKWTMRTTSHSMWNEIYDDKGRRRMQYFYKAAFYDRSAFTNFDHRFDFRIEPFDKYESDISFEERMLGPWAVCIIDSGEPILTLDSITPKDKEDYFIVQDKLLAIGERYMDEHYPNWKDINAYWD